MTTPAGGAGREAGTRIRRRGPAGQRRAAFFALGLTLSPVAQLAARRALDHALAEQSVALLETVSRAERAAPPALGVVVRLRGEVVGLDYGRGLLELLVDGRVRRIKAAPFDLAALTPGQVVEISCGEFAGERWLLPSNEGARAAQGNFGRAGSASGVVSEIDKARGILRIGARRFRAHPLQLEGLLPGQLVSVGYAEIDGIRWVRRVGLEAGE